MNASFVFKTLTHHQQFVLSSHQNIDGDGLGTMLACDSLLRKLGKESVMIYDGTVPYFYSFLPGIERVIPYDESADVERFKSWVFVAVDCSNPERMGRADLIRQKCDQVINIDHHPDNKSFGTVNLVDHNAPASSLLIYDVIKASGQQIDSDTAIQVLTGFVTDTGGFQFVELNHSLIAVLEELVRAGASVAKIMRYVFKHRRLESLRLLGRALNNLEYLPDFRCSMTHLNKSDYADCQALDEDSEGIVDYGLHIQEAEMSVFIKETAPGRYKVSLRSQGQINILPIAHHFGGGGHFKAAGFKMEGSCNQVKNRFLACLEEFFQYRKLTFPSEPDF